MHLLPAALHYWIDVLSEASVSMSSHHSCVFSVITRLISVIFWRSGWLVLAQHVLAGRDAFCFYRQHSLCVYRGQIISVYFVLYGCTINIDEMSTAYMHPPYLMISCHKCGDGARILELWHWTMVDETFEFLSWLLNSCFSQTGKCTDQLNVEAILCKLSGIRLWFTNHCDSAWLCRFWTMTTYFSTLNFTGAVPLPHLLPVLINLFRPIVLVLPSRLPIWSKRVCIKLVTDLIIKEG